MTHILQLVFLACLFIQGWHYCMLPAEGVSQEEIFGFIRRYGEMITPKFFHKPLFACPVCMSSVYGTIIYWSDIGIHHPIINSYTVTIWVIFCVSLAGLNRIATKFIHS